MKLKRLHFTWAGLAALLLAAGGPSAVRAQVEPEPLGLRIVTDQEVYARGQRVSVSFRVINPSTLTVEEDVLCNQEPFGFAVFSEVGELVYDSTVCTVPPVDGSCIFGAIIIEPPVIPTVRLTYPPGEALAWVSQWGQQSFLNYPKTCIARVFSDFGFYYVFGYSVSGRTEISEPALIQIIPILP